MYVRFLQDWGSWKKGEVTDEVSEALGQVLIKEGQAEQANQALWVRSSIASELEKIRKEAVDHAKAELQASRSANGSPASGPPNGGGQLVTTLQADTITHDSSPVDREISKYRWDMNDRRSGKAPTDEQINAFGRVLRMVGVVGKPSGHNPSYVHFADRCLQAMSGSMRESHFDESKGEFVETGRDILPGGSVHTFTRTGTDSLSGGATYGFALKPEYLGNLFEISMEQQVFVNVAQNIPVTQGNEVKWPAWDQYRAPTTANGVTQSAVFAGIQLYYEGESAARVESDALLNMINFKVVDLTGFTALSRDFQRDNHLAFDSALTRMFGRAIGWMEDYMSIQGPGLGKPQGYFNGPSTLVVNRANANKVSSNDLMSMIAAVSPMVWDDLRWITNITTFPQLAILANSSGTAIFQPNALVSQAMKFSIMEKSIGGRGAELMHHPMGDLIGFPVYFSEKVPTLGNTGDMSLVAPSQYGVARREGLEMGVSEHFYFSEKRAA